MKTPPTLKRLDKLFNMDVARSGGTKDYPSGSTPFVTSSQVNNGVVAYVEPLEGDKIFCGPAIAISGLGHATVHTGKFLPKGNGGDSLTVLKPKETATLSDLISMAASFNALHSWRFSFGRKCSKSRLASLEIPFPPADIKKHISKDINQLEELVRDFMTEALSEKAGTSVLEDLQV